MMIIKFAVEEQSNVLPIMSDHHKLLRKAVSDVTMELSKISKDFETIVELSDSSDDDDNDDDETTFQAECECCGLNEECTRGYILRVRSSYLGKWLCGLCSEAVKERLCRMANMEEAMETHANFVQTFNKTTRVNPILSLAKAMRAIAKRSCEKRMGRGGGKMIVRSSSCVPRID